MEPYILVLWITFLNSPHANTNGGIAMQEFGSKTACERALRVVTEGARNVAGVCLASGKGIAT